MTSGTVENDCQITYLPLPESRSSMLFELATRTLVYICPMMACCGRKVCNLHNFKQHILSRLSLFQIGFK